MSKHALTISGHSDDVVYYVLGDETEDELSPPNTDDTPYMGTLLVHSAKGRCLVHVLFDACWSFAVSKVDEDDGDLFPFTTGWLDYSQVLSLTVPKGTKVEWRA
jgi:hypothetical protein